MSRRDYIFTTYSNNPNVQRLTLALLMLVVHVHLVETKVLKSEFGQWRTIGLL